MTPGNQRSLHLFSPYAKCILALDGGGVRGVVRRFRREVEAATSLIPNHPDSTEMERIELLNGVAGELRSMKQPLTDPDMSFCRDLLQHLASQSTHATTRREVSLAD